MWIMNQDQIVKMIKRQLACELNCDPEDFSKEENIITTGILHEKRRMFSDRPCFLQMVTFGNNAVISADDRLHPWLHEWAGNRKGICLFEQPWFYELEKELRSRGHRMAPTHHMFVPEPKLMEAPTGLKIRWLEQDGFAEYYGREEFANALCDRFRPERPDVLAVTALDGDTVMGMAGCSADTPQMWQIGIDVLPEYRGKGIGRTLVTLLRNEALRRGAIPYYGTSLSNIPSWKTALSSGFIPAWVETESTEITAEAQAAEERSIGK